MQQANVPIRPQFPRWNVVLRRRGQNSSAAGQGFAQTAVVQRGGRSLHAVTASKFVRRMPLPQIFRPHADSVARATLVTLLLGPFAIAACLLDHAIELHH